MKNAKTGKIHILYESAFVIKYAALPPLAYSIAILHKGAPNSWLPALLVRKSQAR